MKIRGNNSLYGLYRAPYFSEKKFQYGGFVEKLFTDMIIFRSKSCVYLISNNVLIKPTTSLRL